MPDKRMGRLEVITGCMFSGKTEELFRRLHRTEFVPPNSPNPQEFILFKPTTDDRYKKEKVSTHSGQEFDALLVDPEEISVGTLIESAGQGLFERATIIAFDEGQFFSDKLFDLCKQLIRMGKRVIVAGLDLDFAEKPFDPMPAVIALANPQYVDKLTAVCVRCGGEAIRTQRLVDTQDRILVGGKKDYEARCLNCYEPPE